MPYNDLITRGDAASLIPDEVAAEVIKSTTQQSAALTLCRRARMGSATLEQPVLSSLPEAYWLSGDTGLKQTTSAAWSGVSLKAEEVAVVVPCPLSVLADSTVDIWNELRDPIAEKIALRLDAAVLSGIDKPASWPPSLLQGATAAGQVIQADSPIAQGGIIGDLGRLLGLIEDADREPTGWAAARRLRGLMRRARTTTGELLGEMDLSRAWDLPFTFAVSGSLPQGVLAIAGQFDLAIVGVRQDITFQVFTEGVITDEQGRVVLNLMQQDSAALRVVARYGFAVAEPASLGGDGYPFAVLEAGSAGNGAGGGEDAEAASTRARATAAKKS
jgi:HK97 family phage major capsid protein